MILIVVGIVLYLAAYFTIGWRLAQRDLPNAWERARARWHSEGVAASEAREQTFAMILFWPIALPSRAVQARFRRLVDAGDPQARERELARREKELAEREAAIARLERELGIGGRR